MFEQALGASLEEPSHLWYIRFGQMGLFILGRNPSRKRNTLVLGQVCWGKGSSRPLTRRIKSQPFPTHTGAVVAQVNKGRIVRCAAGVGKYGTGETTSKTRAGSDDIFIAWQVKPWNLSNGKQKLNWKNWLMRWTGTAGTSRLNIYSCRRITNYSSVARRMDTKGALYFFGNEDTSMGCRLVLPYRIYFTYLRRELRPTHRSITKEQSASEADQSPSYVLPITSMA